MNGRQQGGAIEAGNPVDVRGGDGGAAERFGGARVDVDGVRFAEGV